MLPFVALLAMPLTTGYSVVSGSVTHSGGWPTYDVGTPNTANYQGRSGTYGMTGTYKDLSWYASGAGQSRAQTHLLESFYVSRSNVTVTFTLGYTKANLSDPNPGTQLVTFQTGYNMYIGIESLDSGGYASMRAITWTAHDTPVTLSAIRSGIVGGDEFYEPSTPGAIEPSNVTGVNATFVQSPTNPYYFTSTVQVPRLDAPTEGVRCTANLNSPNLGGTVNAGSSVTRFYRVVAIGSSWTQPGY